MKKTVLITGSAGFIGFHLVKAMLNNGYHVVGIDNFSTGYLKNLHEVKKTVGLKRWKNFKFTKGDISNLKDCQKVIKNVELPSRIRIEIPPIDWKLRFNMKHWSVIPYDASYFDVDYPEAEIYQDLVPMLKEMLNNVKVPK